MSQAVEPDSLPVILPGQPSRPLAVTPRLVGRFDLARLPWLRRMLLSRWPLFLARSLTVAGLAFTILAGLFGSPVGSHNFAILFVWIAWWTALKLLFIPVGGRSWCSVCPIPVPGEWLQQGGFLNGYRQRRGLGWRWPRWLRGYWLQAGAFLLIGLFSALTLTDPRLTAWILLGLVLLSAALSLVFERRAFCNHLCPIGGFTGLYAQAAPLELRVIDTTICTTHGDKSCYHACPWGIYPLALRDSSACGLCMECLRACPKDNLALNLRPFGADLAQPRPSNRLDEAFMALTMLGTALAFAAVFTGPWGWLKNAAYRVGSAEWLAYSVGFLALVCGLLPGAFALAVWAGDRLAGGSVNVRRSIADNAQILLPLGLFAWIAFTISFALPKASLVLANFSDPFGWGWNLFGTAHTTLALENAVLGAFLQALLVLAGLICALLVLRRLWRVEGKDWQQAAPLVIFCLVYTLAMLGLLVG